MIDIHSHILPGLDDGAKIIEDSLEMARQLHQSGFKTLIATPHVMEGSDFLSPEKILAAVAELRKNVAEAEIPVEILPGAENYIFPDLGKWAHQGKLLTLGNTGKYLLMELPMLEIPHYTEQVFFDLQVQGLTPILAHPERNRGLIDRPEYLVEWANKGVLFQLNLRSLSGRYGPQVQELAERMIRSKLIHFVGSDAHRPSQEDTDYLKALRSTKEMTEDDGIREITINNPQAILAGRALPEKREYTLHTLKRKKKRRFWEFF
ncbi:capsular polysaccharide biosynthesis protein [Desulfosporosinus orientis DSM 765]|uniref:protein-tyrosine-phosphatase n=1 Tax=Desulfosporosinus orientis (strain ATCC 19365 / DSM 765 / NCIMB 8382 / VKM B-1628 / Singapore I) TaxID=768706 RepID=G7W772_DESOD|nr:CpsB/CapC family capsule biosynthesis tyrosine phosphatase [Desulfosporosinus orientis]AET70580.1 capsular polysaccharide biosynthesis protein [Desulfosporosinus orientis DSM 765]